MSAKTSDAPVLVQLDPLFEGTFSLSAGKGGAISVGDALRATGSTESEQDRKLEWKSSRVRGTTVAHGHTYLASRGTEVDDDSALTSTIVCQTTNGDVQLLV